MIRIKRDNKFTLHTNNPIFIISYKNLFYFHTDGKINFKRGVIPNFHRRKILFEEVAYSRINNHIVFGYLDIYKISKDDIDKSLIYYDKIVDGRINIHKDLFREIRKFI